jgi:hypothetical protein
MICRFFNGLFDSCPLTVVVAIFVSSFQTPTAKKLAGLLLLPFQTQYS